jgi:hypothetical protein
MHLPCSYNAAEDRQLNAAYAIVTWLLIEGASVILPSRR